jgi:hypothetical protein
MEEQTGSELVVVKPAELMRLATDVAGVCRDIVNKTALNIEGKKYVRVEGWQAIANSFGYAASSRDVTKVYDPTDDRFLGFRAIGEVKRMSDGMVIATAEGFVGIDEVRWFGGEREAYNKDSRKKELKMYLPAAEYAARGMAQTRAMSRACRTAFAFVVVLIDKGLSTTPAEEIEPGDEPHGEIREERNVTPKTNGNGEPARWQASECSYGTKGGPLRGKLLGELTEKNLDFLHGKFVKALDAKQVNELSEPDKAMREGLILWHTAGKAEAA